MPNHRVDLEKRDATNPAKFCQQCGKQLHRKRFSNSAPESDKCFDRRKFCGERCFAAWETDRPEKGTAEKRASGVMRCPKCSKVKPVSDFPKKGFDRFGVGRYGYCRPCHSEYQRVVKLASNYGISPEEFDTLMLAQGTACAICGSIPKEGRRLHVDHRHSDGLLRGGLCFICNRVLGMFRDNPDRFAAAAAYLRNPPALVALGGPRYGTIGKANKRSTLLLEKRVMRFLADGEPHKKTEVRLAVHAEAYRPHQFKGVLDRLVQQKMISIDRGENGSFLIQKVSPETGTGGQSGTGARSNDPEGAGREDRAAPELHRVPGPPAGGQG